MTWEHELALVLVGFAGGILVALGAYAGAKARERRCGMVDLTGARPK